MTPETAVQLIRHALMTTFWLALPLLVLGFAAGVVISLVQIVTSMQDSAFSTIPRLVVFLVGLVLQVPVVVAVIAIARRVVKVVASARRPSRPPSLSQATATVVGVTRAATGVVMTAGGHGRAPPVFLQS